MEEIKLNDILHLSDEEIRKYKLHLAAASEGTQPLDVFIRDKEEWKGKISKIRGCLYQFVYCRFVINTIPCKSFFIFLQS